MELALLQLLAFRLRGGLRARLLQLLSVRGLIYSTTTLLVLVFMWAIIRNASVSPDRLAIESSVRMETFMVLGLVAATLLPALTASSPVFHFTPEEIHFLRAGPFSHQSLLLYKVLSAATGAAFSGLVLAAITSLLYGRLPAAVFFGTLLTLLFVRLSSATVRSLWRLILPTRSAALPTSANSVFATGLLVTSAWLLLARFGEGAIETMLALCETPAGEFLLLPFRTFVRVTLADRMFPDLIFWSALAAAINLGLLFLLLRTERAIETFGVEDLAASSDNLSQQQASRVNRIAAPLVSTRLLSYPMAGVAPIAWRQLVQVRRSHGTTVLGFTVIAILGGPLLVQGFSDVSPMVKIGLALTFAIFVLPKAMTFDFRGDGQALPALKELPLHPLAIAAGQLTTPVILASCIEILLLGSVICLSGDSPVGRLAALVPFVFPFNVLLFSLENTLFLLAPFRLMPVGRIDFEFFGRSVVETLAKMLLLSVAIGVSIRFGKLVSDLLGHSQIGFYAATWVAMSFAASVAVLMVASVFKRSETAMEN